MQQLAWRVYARVLDHPKTLLAMLVVLTVVAGSQLSQLKFDATSETLVVENDPEFAEYLAFAERFPSDEFVLITLTPKHYDILSPEGLSLIAEVETEVGQLPGVAATLSLLDIPYVHDQGMQPLSQSGLEPAQMAAYLSSSPLFYEQIISGDLKSAGIRVTFERTVPSKQMRTLLRDLRQLVRGYDSDAIVHIGGVPLISHDMMRFVQSDVQSFGIASLVLMTLVLILFFRRFWWVAIAIVNAAVSIVIMLGYLGATGIPISVVSANFVAILAITSISLNIHLIVKFRELIHAQSDEPFDHAALVKATMLSKFAPCLYTALTTIVAFTSLLTSDIPPVEDFGWMMAVGVLCAFVVAFLLFPALVLTFRPSLVNERRYRPVALSVAFGKAAAARPVTIVAITVLLMGGSAFGVALVSLDSKFSQYFKPDSDIRRGLEFIDQQFGGVLPLNFVVHLQPFTEPQADDDDDDGFGSFDLEEEVTYPASAWFTQDKIDVAYALATFLRGHPDVGSVVSLSDLEALARYQTDQQPLTDLQLAVMVTSLGDARRDLLEPYANALDGDLRFALRMRETTAAASYPKFLQEVDDFAHLALPVHLRDISSNGMFILFGQSIRQLFESQLNTLLYVVGMTLLMFIALLRSLKFGLIGISVNILAGTVVLGAMGFVGIPMDMMTLTIAAISIGIGVDDAFHYLHRYREERAAGASLSAAIKSCHLSIGRAIYLTSITVMVGFSVLLFSNFIPTIYFGGLTALAMGIALLANLLVLPALLICVERYLRVSAHSQA